MKDIEMNVDGNLQKVESKVEKGIAKVLRRVPKFLQDNCFGYHSPAPSEIRNPLVPTPYIAFNVAKICFSSPSPPKAFHSRPCSSFPPTLLVVSGAVPSYLCDDRKVPARTV